MRYVNPFKYEITSCNECLRNKYIYELFAETGLYDYYEEPQYKTTLVKKNTLIIYFLGKHYYPIIN